MNSPYRLLSMSRILIGVRLSRSRSILSQIGSEAETRLNVSRKREKLFREKSGFGLNEVIGIAAGIIIAVVIVIPGLQVFAANVLAQLTNWWNNMAADIFN